MLARRPPRPAPSGGRLRSLSSAAPVEIIPALEHQVPVGWRGGHTGNQALGRRSGQPRRRRSEVLGSGRWPRRARSSRCALGRPRRGRRRVGALRERSERSADAPRGRWRRRRGRALAIRAGQDGARSWFQGTHKPFASRVSTRTRRRASTIITFAITIQTRAGTCRTTPSRCAADTTCTVMCEILTR